MDPIADRFPWVSTYNYAENEPVRHIDLHGLQKYDPQTGQTGPYSNEYIAEQEEKAAYEKIKASTVTEIIDNPNAEHQALSMMEIFSPDNVGIAFGLYSPTKLPSTRNLSLTLPLLDDGISAALNIEKGAWAQTTFSSTFSKTGQKILSKTSGQTIQTIDDAVGALQSGKLSVSDLPIDAVIREGNTLILNTRSSVALTKAGIPRSQWNVVDRTGQKLYENLLDGQLQRNDLTNAGTNTVRQSGTQNVINN